MAVEKSIKSDTVMLIGQNVMLEIDDKLMGVAQLSNCGSVKRFYLAMTRVSLFYLVYYRNCVT